MKYSIVGIAALAALLVSQGCSSVTNSGDTSHDGHSSEHMHHHGHSTKDKGENSTITQAKLTTPQKNFAESICTFGNCYSRYSR